MGDMDEINELERLEKAATAQQPAPIPMRLPCPGCGELHIDDCVVTFEQTRDALEAVERQLAERLRLRRKDIRRAIIELDRRGKLVEDDLVADWHDLYASFLDWTREEIWGASLPSRAQGGGGQMSGPGDEELDEVWNSLGMCATTLEYVQKRRAVLRRFAREQRAAELEALADEIAPVMGLRLGAHRASQIATLRMRAADIREGRR